MKYQRSGEVIVVREESAHAIRIQRCRSGDRHHGLRAMAGADRLQSGAHLSAHFTHVGSEMIGGQVLGLYSGRFLLAHLSDWVWLTYKR